MTDGNAPVATGILSQDHPGAELSRRLRRAALAYAARGIPVFPCVPGEKKPLTDDGFLSATTDPRRIHAWWTKWPTANVGVPTGKVSGFFVVDEDRAGALEELEREHGPIPATWRVRTGRDGRHLYLKFNDDNPVRNSAGKIAQGIDVRGDGGYVMVPPSVTEGPYEVLDRLPVAEPPAWLLEAATRQPSPTTAPVGDRGRSGPVPVDSGPIPYGQRGDTLARIAGRLHDGTRTLDQLAADLEAVNRARCVPPVGEHPTDRPGEVEKIARSIHARPPCKPGAGSGAVPEEIRDDLARIEAVHLWGRSWSGSRWKSPRSVLVALIRIARKHGKHARDGVRVSASIRQLALEAGLGGKTTTTNAIRRLMEAGILRREHTTKRDGAGVLVLRTPRQGRNSSQVQPSTVGGGPVAVPTLSRGAEHEAQAMDPAVHARGGAPLTAERLRWSAPVYETIEGVRVRTGTILRLGKSAEAVVDALEAAGRPLTLHELADVLEISRPWNLTRAGKGPVPRLEARGIVKVDGNTVSLRLALDWLNILDRARAEDREIKDRERDERRYSEETRHHRNRLEVRKLDAVGLDPAEIAAASGIGLDDVLAHLGLTRIHNTPETDAIPEEAGHSSREDYGDGTGAEPDPVPPAHEGGPDPELVAAVRSYLYRNPDRVSEPPGWIGNTLWGFNLYPGKPTPQEVAAALRELGLRRAA